MTEAEKNAKGLTEAQREFVRSGNEGIFGDRRIAKALCGKKIMGVAGYVIGETVYAFTPLGLEVRRILEKRNDGE